MRGNHLDAADVLGLLRRRVKAAGGLTPFCQQVRAQRGISLSVAYLSQIMSGHRPLCEKVWKALGLRMILLFEPIDDDPPARPKGLAASQEARPHA